MPKKKNPRLPNGYGSIRYLGKGRTNPYAVLAPSKEKDILGRTIYNPPIAYVDSWNKAFSVLVMYHAGTWKEGSKIPAVLPENMSFNLQQGIVNEILRKLAPEAIDSSGLTFKEVYDKFFKWKFEEDKKDYSNNTVGGIRAGFKNSKPLHNKVFINIKYKDLQETVDNLQLKYSSKAHVVNTIKQMYTYAIMFEITDKNQAAYLRVKEENDNIHGVPFSDEELKILWQHKENDIAEMILIMCYSGFRISAFENMEINLTERYFRGGVKVKSTSNRIVPIHSSILPLVENRLNRCKSKRNLFNFSTNHFRMKMHNFLSSIQLENHTPHDCRHTFSRLCDKYSVYENDKKRMLGHTFQDITNSVYGHADMDKMRKEIEKIQPPKFN